MADNFPLTPGAGRNAATDQVTYSGDTADVQLMRPVVVTGAEGSKTVVDLPGDATNGWDVDVTRVKPDGTNVMPSMDVAARAAFHKHTDGTLTAGIVDETGSSAVDAAAVGGGTPHDSVDSGNPIKIGARAIAMGANPTAVAAGDRTDLLANRAGVPYAIGGHPNVISYGMSLTTAVSNTIIGPTIGAGLKLVLTRLTLTLDNASTVFPTVTIGFGTANTPAFATTPGTSGVVAGHPAVPAGGGFNIGDGSGIIAMGADNEELRITTVGNAGGAGIYVTFSGYTIES